MSASRIPGSPRGSSPLGPLLALAAFGLYASHDAVVKGLGATYSALQIMFFVGLFGFPLVAIMLLRDPVPGTLQSRHPRLVLLRAIAMVGSGTLGFYGFSVLPMAQVYTMLFSAPLIVTILSVPMLGERVGLHRGLAVLAGMAGVLVVLRPGVEPVSLGHAASLGAAVFVALAALIARKIGAQERSALLMVTPLLLTVLVLGALMPFVYVPVSLPDLGLMAVVAILSFAAGLLLLIAYRKSEAALVAPMQYSQILWAGVYGYLLFDEMPDRWTLGGSALIIASGLYIVFRESRRNVSANRPVLRARSRIGSVSLARTSLLDEAEDSHQNPAA
jgi:S-adenosylmethionine uptake transporter